MKINTNSLKTENGNSSKVAEFLNSVLLMKSNEEDLYDSMFSNLDTSVFLDRNGSDVYQDDRRGSIRFEIPLNVVTEDVQKNIYSMDLIINLSTCGAKIDSINTFTKGDKVNMHILFPEMDDPFDIQGSVIWAQNEIGKNTKYGIEFDNTVLRINKVFEAIDNLKTPYSSIY